MRDLRKESGRKRDMMYRKMLMEAFLRNIDDYREAYPQTADSDLNLVKAYCSGSSAAHVALDCNCAESTVYRAVNRVRDFLNLQDQGDILRPLIDHVMEHPPNFGDCNASGVLEMLYETYSDYNNMDDETVKQGFRELYQLLEEADPSAVDPVIYVVCGLCRAHQRTGFTEGIKIGVRLSEELNQE